MSIRSLATAVVIAAVLPTIATSGEGWTRFEFDEERPLAIDLTRIAVHQVGSGLEGAISATIPGWEFATVPAQRRNDAGIQTMVAELAASGVFASPVFYGDDRGPVFVTAQLLVAFHPGVPVFTRDSLAVSITGASIVERDWAGMEGAYRLASPFRDGFEVLASANALARLPETLYAEPDFAFTGRGGHIPNDPLFSTSWGLHNTGQSAGIPDRDIDAPEAWDITMGSASIQVVVIDTGVDQAHPDLNLGAGSDWTGEGGGGAPVNACDNHGTPVAGCISGKIDNGIGTTGIAPNCPTASARAFISLLSCSGNWSSNASWTVNAINWAQTIGARVTNNSNFYGFTSSAIASKYASTRNAGIIHFASAGNDSNNVVTYPATLPTVYAIAATTRTGTKASFSNTGPEIAFAAPGVSVQTTDRSGTAGWSSGDYVLASGTSFASPLAAGVAALILSVDPSLDADGVDCRLRLTSTDYGAPGYDTSFGWGQVNAHLAVAPQAITRAYGSGVNPAGSLFVLGTPKIGTTLPLLVHNPLGTQGTSLPIVAVSAGPDPNFPAGALIPGWGMNGLSGELLVSISPGNPLALPTGAAWTGSPVLVDLPFPNDAGLIGTCFYAQGILFDPAGPIRFGLTEAVEMQVGP